MSPAKTAEPIEMLFGLSPRNHVLDRRPDPPMGRANLMGDGTAHCKVSGHYAVICAKTAEPIEMPFRLWVWMDPKNHVLDAVQITHGKGQFGGIGAPIVKYGDFPP